MPILPDGVGDRRATACRRLAIPVPRAFPCHPALLPSTAVSRALVAPHETSRQVQAIAGHCGSRIRIAVRSGGRYFPAEAESHRGAAMSRAIAAASIVVAFVALAGPASA